MVATAAESYERFRPGYPDEIVDRALSYAGRPVRTAIELGAATGKATRAFASRGIHVTALEPDPVMFAVLERETVGMPVDPSPRTLKTYDGPPADLVYAAERVPSRGWDRVARVLVPGGVLVLFRSRVRPLDPGVRVAEPRESSITDAVPDGLADVEEHHLTRHLVMPPREFVGYLSTTGVYADLTAEQRQEMLRRTAEALPAQVRVEASVTLVLARRHEDG
jgi:SAM-dependent methyltransferase